MGLLRWVFGDEREILFERDFQALLLANIAGPLGSALLSPILDSLIDPFATSPADIGLMISFFTAPAIIMIPIAGFISDRIGRKPVLVSSLFLFGLAGSAIAITTDYRTVLSLRLLQGVAFGGLIPVIITSIGDVYDGTAEATAQGIRFTGSGITQAVFPLLSGVIVVFGWQYPFLFYALSIPIAVVVYYWFDEPGDDDETPDTGAESVRSQVRALFNLTRQRRVLAMVIARGLPVVFFIGFFTYNSIIVLRIMGGTPAQAGVLAAFFSIIYALASTQAGRVTSMFESRLYPLLGANVCLGVGFVIFLFAPQLWVAGTGIGIVGIGVGLTMSIYRSIITGLASDSLRGGLVSLSEAFGRTTATITPLVMGGVIAIVSPDFGLGPAVQVAGLGVAVIGSVGGVICLLVANWAPPVQ